MSSNALFVPLLNSNKGDALSETVIVVANGIGDSNSNPGRDCISLFANACMLYCNILWNIVQYWYFSIFSN